MAHRITPWLLTLTSKSLHSARWHFTKSRINPSTESCSSGPPNKLLEVVMHKHPLPGFVQPWRQLCPPLLQILFRNFIFEAVDHHNRQAIALQVLKSWAAKRDRDCQSEQCLRVLW